MVIVRFDGEGYLLGSDIPLLLDKEDGKHLLFEAAKDHNPGQLRLEGTMPGEVHEKTSKNVTPFKAAQSN